MPDSPGEGCLLVEEITSFVRIILELTRSLESGVVRLLLMLEPYHLEMSRKPVQRSLGSDFHPTRRATFLVQQRKQQQQQKQRKKTTKTTIALATRVNDNRHPIHPTHIQRGQGAAPPQEVFLAQPRTWVDQHGNTKRAIA